MMAVTKLALFLTAVSLAAANPATLQRLYDGPVSGGQSRHHRTDGHAHADSVPAPANIQSDLISGNVQTSSNSNLDQSFPNNLNSGSATGSTGQGIFNFFGSSDGGNSATSGQSSDNDGNVDSGLTSGSSSGDFNVDSGLTSGSSSGDFNVDSGLTSGSSSGDFNVDSGLTSGSSSGDFNVFGRGSVVARALDSAAQRGSNIGIDARLSSGGQSVNLRPSVPSSPRIQFEGSVQNLGSEGITITREVTMDVFKTLTNVIYNSIPVTLTQFLKTTAVRPTLQVVSTPVDNAVFVATAPVTRTDTASVTDTRTAYQYATEVSTDLYTITHRAYDIQQQTVTSTLVQTEVYRPTVVSTYISTEYEAQTVLQTVTNTIVVEPRAGSSAPVAHQVSGLQHQQRPLQQKQFSIQQLQTFARMNQQQRESLLSGMSLQQQQILNAEFDQLFGNLDVAPQAAQVQSLGKQHHY